MPKGTSKANPDKGKSLPEQTSTAADGVGDCGIAVPPTGESSSASGATPNIDQMSSAQVKLITDALAVQFSKVQEKEKDSLPMDSVTGNGATVEPTTSDSTTS